MEPTRRTDGPTSKPSAPPGALKGSAAPAAPAAPAAYEPPTLVELGTLRDLTATGSHTIPTVLGE